MNQVRLRRGLHSATLLAVLLAACAAPTAAPQPTAVVTPTSFPLHPPSAEVAQRVDALMVEMTNREKIGQMTQVEKDSLQPGDITTYFIGSVLTGGGSAPLINTPEGWLEMVNGYQAEALDTRLQIPLIFGLDAIHGHAAMYGATVFPQPVGLGAAGDPELARQVGAATAEEMRAVGVPWDFAPIVAVPQDIRWGRTYESYSEDTALVTELSAAFLDGLQELPEGYAPAPGQTIYVLATPKHFLGDGGTKFGTSTQEINEPYLIDQGDMRYSEADVRRLFLPPYQQALQSGALSVMVSFSSWDGEKMHARGDWITGVLKGELAFQGFVVSDWAGVDQIDEDYYTSVVTAINAGIDMVMVPYDYIRFIETMERALENGVISQDRVDDAVRRILTVKVQLGLFDLPDADPALLASIGSQEHRLLARQAVRQSLVLLKNDNETLPLAKDTAVIYVAGLGADDMGMQCGGWTTTWQGTLGDIQPGTTLLEGIRQAVAPTTRVEYDPSAAFTGMADVGIAVVGEQPYAEGVGDTNSLNLSNEDIQVIESLRAHSRRLIVVILSGRPLVITRQFNSADAWVAAWLPGSEGAGVSDVLFGDFPFTGRTPYTWPRKHSQLPINVNSSAGLTGCDAPLFPYGYGLGQAGSEPVNWLDCP